MVSSMYSMDHIQKKDNTCVFQTILSDWDEMALPNLLYIGEGVKLWLNYFLVFGR